MEEKKMVESKEVVVLDEGIDVEATPSNSQLCCWGPFFAYRA